MTKKKKTVKKRRAVRPSAKKTVKIKNRPATKRRAISTTKKTRKPMAKKRKSARKTRRRSRISGMAGIDLQTLALMAAGAIAGRIAQNKLSGKVNPKILAGGQIAAGGYLVPSFIKNPMAKAVGAGMAVNGVIELVKSFGIISGIDDGLQVDFIGDISQTIAGPGINAEIAGYDEESDNISGTATDDEVMDYELQSGMGRFDDDSED